MEEKYISERDRGEKDIIRELMKGQKICERLRRKD